MELYQKFMSAPVSFMGDYVLPFVLVLSILVFVHEWGHYIVARLCGVKVETFSIGFGQKLFGWKDKKGTLWKVSWIPLGGYVQMFGDTDPASAGHADAVKMTPEERKVAFFSQSVGRRSAIVAAGPAINFLFAIVIMTALFTVEGQPFTPPIAGAVMEDSAAAKGGVKPDDKIIEVNGQEIEKFQDIVTAVAVNLDKEMTVKVLRSTGKNKWSETPKVLKIKPKLIEETDRFGFRHSMGRIGVVAPKDAMEMKPHTFPSAIAAATAETWRISASTLKALGQMVMGTRSKDELGGVLRIGAYAGQFAKDGFVSLVGFAALLSVNLGLINLLPIPILDGGHLAFYAMETVKGKPLGEKAQEYALRTGMIFLLCVMVFATWNDLVQLKVVDYVVKLVS